MKALFFSALLALLIASGAIGTVVNGNLGLYPGSVASFPPGILNGNLQIANAAGLAAQSDLTVAYNNDAGKAAD
ncbi:hypothetical protein B484DRAFT_402980 [Ochromonadaceae sp. CCMP2298]|nr:hypothetical protein B484DRAFT_402980 [Ochromonadaceae sp. CCMP2298]